ncbi:MAG: oligoribonuclease, partial [Gammaproteobacteria bacterium]|nr:oligoribonuclease [Gammaproteobacteria bacterium]
MSPHPQNLIWIDLEMTGLNPLEDHIIEIATLVTDKDLMIIAEGPELVIHQPQAVLDGMDEWNRTHHGQSGLIARVLESSLQVEEAEAKTLAFLHQWVPQGVSPICGNSICQDRRFLAREMP